MSARDLALGAAATLNDSEGIYDDALASDALDSSLDDRSFRLMITAMAEAVVAIALALTEPPALPEPKLVRL